MERVPPEMQGETINMLTNTKSSKSQKRNNFKLKGVSRSIIDELEVLAATCACATLTVLVIVLT